MGGFPIIFVIYVYSRKEVGPKRYEAKTKPSHQHQHPYSHQHTSTSTSINTKVEEVLINSKEFSLPGRKALVKSDIEWEVVLVDSTESVYVSAPKKKV